MNLLKLLQTRDINDFYFARYEDWGNFVSILIKEDQRHYYDILNNRVVADHYISHIKPLSNYVQFDKKSISLRTARKTGKILLSKFEADIKSEPKRWEPKVLIKDTIPHLKVTNNQINETSSNEKELPTTEISENKERKESKLPSKEEVMKELAEQNPYLKKTKVSEQEPKKETKDEDDWHKYYFRHHEYNIIEIVRKGYYEDKKIFYGEVKASRDEILRAAESLMNVQILVGGNVCPFDKSEYTKLILNGHGFGYYQLLIGIDPDRQVYEDAKNYFESFKHELSSEI